MMRKGALCTGVVAILFSMVVSASAATMEDIVGEWGVLYQTNAKVSKVGSDISTGGGIITFTAGVPGSNSGTFGFEDLTQGYFYTGTFVLSPDGKKLTMSLDAGGVNELFQMMTNWLMDVPLDVTLQDPEFTTESGVVINPVKTSKKTNGPTKGVVSAKGTVSAYVVEEGIVETSNFSYKTTVTFLSKID